MYSTDPVKDAGDYMDKLLGYNERMAEAEHKLEISFVKACLCKDAEDDVDFHDIFNYKTRTSRPAKVWETMYVTFDSEGVTDYVMQSLLLCAKKGDTDAQSAIRKMAKAFAREYAYVEE